MSVNIFRDIKSASLVFIYLFIEILIRFEQRINANDANTNVFKYTNTVNEILVLVSA